MEKNSSLEDLDVVVQTAMNIILHAGNARNNCEQALLELKKFNFDNVHEYMKSAKENIGKAHIAQTKLIQDEARGKHYPHSLLFTHAQDTLMTIKSEVALTEHLIDLFKIINKKLEVEPNK